MTCVTWTCDAWTCTEVVALDDDDVCCQNNDADILTLTHGPVRQLLPWMTMKCVARTTQISWHKCMDLCSNCCLGWHYVCCQDNDAYVLNQMHGPATQKRLRKLSFELTACCIKSIRTKIEVLTAKTTKSYIFLDTTPCSLMKVNRWFGGNYRLRLQVRRISQARNKHRNWSAEKHRIT
jgi:hypothetical protein